MTGASERHLGRCSEKVRQLLDRAQPCLVHVDHHPCDDQLPSGSPSLARPEAHPSLKIRAPFRLTPRWTRLMRRCTQDHRHTRHQRISQLSLRDALHHQPSRSTDHGPLNRELQSESHPTGASARIRKMPEHHSSQTRPPNLKAPLPTTGPTPLSRLRRASHAVGIVVAFGIDGRNSSTAHAEAGSRVDAQQFRGLRD